MLWQLPTESRGVVFRTDQVVLSEEVREHLRRELGYGESVSVVPYPARERGVRIVEVAGAARRVLWEEPK
jgi:hypothetical protein